MVSAQRHELGLFMGGANVIGDVGKGSYINPFPVKQTANGSYFLNGSLGALYRFNFNPYMGLRANLSVSRVAAGDYVSGEQYKVDRKENFSNSIIEGSILYEYNFTDINDDQYFAHSPYIFFGVGLANYRHQIYDLDKNNKVVSVSKRENDFVIPFGVGYKVKFNYNWVISAETGFRYTGKDALDYNNPKFTDRLLKAGQIDPLIQSNIDNKIFGNISNNDWYVLTGLTLTYTFGRSACYCN